MRSSASWVPYRFFLALGLVLLLLASLWLGLVFGFGSYAAIDRLRHIRYHDGTYHYLPIILTSLNYWRAKTLLICLLLGITLLLLRLYRKHGIWQEITALKSEFRAMAPLLAPWRKLEPRQQQAALWSVGALLLVRGYYSVQYPLYGDEVVTYLCFVREGAVAATSFYPIPNNHVLYSSICWLFSLLSDNFFVVMRLPNFLISCLSTVLTGLLLLRYLTFRSTIVAVIAFGFFSHALLQAVIGRGYLLQVACAQVSFVAAVSLLRGSTKPRVVWLTLVGSGVAGLYAVPTFLLAYGGLVAGLALGLSWQVQFRLLAQLGLAGLLTGLTVLLLYTPILLVSGSDALFNNSYVALSQTHTKGLAAVFNYLGRAEGELLGHNPLGLLLSVGVTLAVGAAARWWPAFRGIRLVALLALSIVWTGYLLAAGLGIEAPARALSFRAFFLLLLGALLVDTFLRQWAINQLWLTVVLPLLLWATGALLLFRRQATVELGRNSRVEEVYTWLRQQNARRVIVTRGHYQLYLLFYSKYHHYPLHLDDSPVGTQPYDFQILDKEKPLLTSCSGRGVFTNQEVYVCQPTR